MKRLRQKFEKIVLLAFIPTVLWITESDILGRHHVLVASVLSAAVIYSLSQYAFRLKWDNEVVRRRVEDEHTTELLTQQDILLENSYVGMSIVKNGVVQRGNARLAEIFGYRSKEELVGMPCSDFLVTTLEPKNTLDFINREIEHKGHCQLEIPILRKDGQEITIMMTGRPISKDDLSIGSIWTLNDISKMREDETSRRIASIAFESQEGMSVTNVDAIILHVNAAFTELTGYTVQEIVGKNLNILQSGRDEPDLYPTMWKQLRAKGKWQGEVWSRRKNGEVYPDRLTVTAVLDAAQNVTHYIGEHTDLSAEHLAKDKINQLAFYDQLTGLPNRALLEARLKSAMRESATSKSYCALLFFDLDNFKSLNDTLGHDMGDLLLQKVATRLSTNIDQIDTVARLGGDEFVIVLSQKGTDLYLATQLVQKKAQDLLDVLNKDYLLTDVTFNIAASIGIAVFIGEDLSSATLMKQADLAMYKSKESGRNKFCMFDRELQETIHKKTSLINDLRKGIPLKQMFLQYQPQIDIDSKIIGAEALVRWNHPVRGVISPVEFIPLAEETGLIIQLGSWVLRTACEQLKTWSVNPKKSQLVLSVNVSLYQLRQSNFVSSVKEILAETGADPSRLNLELTESLFAHNLVDIVDKMHELRSEGVRFSLDDFGTGYSSLYYLKRLPLDHLKIDKSFVLDLFEDTNDAVIVKTIVDLAKSLGFGVIAEGVETLQHKEFLANIGCTTYQGFYFSKPLSISAFEDYIEKTTLGKANVHNSQQSLLDY